MKKINQLKMEKLLNKEITKEQFEYDLNVELDVFKTAIKELNEIRSLNTLLEIKCWQDVCDNIIHGYLSGDDEIAEEKLYTIYLKKIALEILYYEYLGL